MEDFLKKKNLFTKKDLKYMGYDLDSMSKGKKKDFLNRKLYEFLS